ncbi:hypothetical protein LB503_008758 [Fusarium chuoi]|nr:hypothetical protein LB503_008758 [Fusarium chuoi]
MKHVEVDDQLVSAATPAPIPEEDLKKSERDLEEGSTSVEFDDPPSDDPNVVNWDGPDDPANPQNWSTKKKTINVILVSSAACVFHICTKYRSSHEGVPLDKRATGIVHRLGIPSRLLLWSPSHRAIVRNVRPAPAVPHLQCSLRHLHCGLRQGP